MYYHYQPGSNICIVYCKHITHACARTHARTRVHTHVHTCVHTQPSPSAARAIAIRWRPTNRDGPLCLRQCQSLAIQINTRTGDPIRPRFWKFFAYKKLLGQTETRTRARMYCQAIRIVRDISRDDQARIATCSLRTLTDRLKENYSIDAACSWLTLAVELAFTTIVADSSIRQAIIVT